MLNEPQALRQLAIRMKRCIAHTKRPPFSLRGAEDDSMAIWKLPRSSVSGGCILAAIEPEHDAPVGAHTDAPLVCAVAAQRVQPIPRQIEIAGPLGDLEIGQDTADTRQEVRRQTLRAVPLEECPQALARESHRSDCIA